MTVSPSTRALAGKKTPSWPATSKPSGGPLGIGVRLRCRTRVHGSSAGIGEAEERTGGDDVFSEDDMAGEEREAFADDLFVSGVNVVLVADVDGYGHSGVGEGEGSALCVTEESPVFFWCAGEGGDLHVEEWEVALMPLACASPGSWWERAVVEGSLA